MTTLLGRVFSGNLPVAADDINLNPNPEKTNAKIRM